MSKSNLPPVHCKLVGEDGNAYFILGRWQAAAKRAGWPAREIERVVKDAMSGDYNHLLRTIADNCADPVGELDEDDED